MQIKIADWVENLLKSIQVVLLIKNQHGFFIVNRIYRSKRNGAITIGYQYHTSYDQSYFDEQIKAWEWQWVITP